eukprot:scpid85371/ scgid12700/ 
MKAVSDCPHSVNHENILEVMKECQEYLISMCIAPAGDDKEAFFRLLCEDESVTSASLLSLQTTPKHVKTGITSQVTPFTMHGLTTNGGSPQVRAEPSTSSASSYPSSDAIVASSAAVYEVEATCSQMTGIFCTVTSHSALGKEAEVAVLTT